MAKDRVRVIMNPEADRGRTRARLPEVERRLAAYEGRSEILFTAGRGHAEELARAAYDDGVDVIAVVGGDGTLGEVVQAYLDPQGNPRRGPDLALIPSGTGGDWRRTLGLGSDIRGALDRVLDGRRVEVDLGVARYCPHPGTSSTRAFLNVASFGLSGVVDDRVKQVPGFVGGRLAYYLAAMRGVMSFRAPGVRVRVDGARWFEGRSLLVAIGNGRYFGGGMLVAPHADPCDGRLAVVAVGDLPWRTALRLSPRLYDGTHVLLRQVQVTSGVTIEAESTHPSGDVLVDIDGEQSGKLPMTVTVHPRAIVFRA